MLQLSAKRNYYFFVEMVLGGGDVAAPGPLHRGTVSWHELRLCMTPTLPTAEWEPGAARVSLLLWELWPALVLLRGW